MEGFLKDLVICVTTVTFIGMCVQMEVIQSNTSGYKIAMIGVLGGISAMHGVTWCDSALTY